MPERSFLRLFPFRPAAPDRVHLPWWQALFPPGDLCRSKIASGGPVPVHEKPEWASDLRKSLVVPDLVPVRRTRLQRHEIRRHGVS